MKKAVVLLSGGLDSTTALYLAKSEGYEVYSICFDYGQRHDKEIQCAKNIAEKAGVKDHVLVKTNMDAWGGSALTDKNIDIPEGDKNREGIPITYVPARNMIFLAYAASYAEVVGAQDIFIGVSQVDYSGYVDCRQEFIEAMENAINLGTVCAAVEGKKIKVRAPFMYMTKTQEVELGMSLGVDYSDTWTCYNGDEQPCGTCDSCLLRIKAFKEAGSKDPLKYKEV
ncbi:MAG: 7-cyano-7-deazaguanine synthase QueC [Clostridiaceae bacterium]|nr:7-cyano-7-deazaguanine synthase QueC [Clostridiaceae bacterium]